MTPRAVFFDVDFTLIFPGPTFRGEGYRDFCARYGMDADPAKFDAAVVSAAPLLDAPDGDLHEYDAEIFVAYTRRIIEQMGGAGPRLDACAREIFGEWAACRHFELYDDVPAVLRALSEAGLRLGLISNSHRCLASFQSHFELEGLIAAAVSSSDHGFMKPHPSIFAAALQLAGARPDEAVMVGDSLRQDVDGALRSGMRAVLLHRGSAPHEEAAALAARGVPVVDSLRELPRLILGSRAALG
ncbi:MAG TPA: HAD family hydrolase [Vicinamibacterales bacterium]|nr:HAD family hydrolase [Vicinamibacterales bacterium]